MYKEDKSTTQIKKVLDQNKSRKMGRDILNAISPIFKGETIENVDKALSSCQELLREESLFTLRPSVKK